MNVLWGERRFDSILLAAGNLPRYQTLLCFVREVFNIFTYLFR